MVVGEEEENTGEDELTVPENEEEEGRMVGRPRRMRRLPAWSEDYVFE